MLNIALPSAKIDTIDFGMLRAIRETMVKQMYVERLINNYNPNEYETAICCIN